MHSKRRCIFDSRNRREIFFLVFTFNLEIDTPTIFYVYIRQFFCVNKLDSLLGDLLILFFQQRIYDLMILNLNMEPTFIVETMALQWTSELTFAENVPALMKQFKKERGLKPFKVKSNNSLSSALCKASLR